MRIYAQKGVSLIEILLIITFTGFLVILISSLPNSLNLITKSRHESLAREVASKKIEDERNIQYSNLVNGTTNIVDSRINLLPNGSGTVLVEDCDTQNICKNGENTKQITITVSWKDISKTQTLILKTLISQEGLVK